MSHLSGQIVGPAGTPYEGWIVFIVFATSIVYLMKKMLKIFGPRTWCTKNLSVIELHTTDTFLKFAKDIDSLEKIQKILLKKKSKC